MRPLLRVVRVSVLLAVVGAIVVSTYAVMTLRYITERLTFEAPIATLRFDMLNGGRARAAMTRLDLCETEFFVIDGEQWQVDVDYLTWTTPVTLLGFEPRYRLNRLSGRRASTYAQNDVAPLAYDLTKSAGWFGDAVQAWLPEGLFVDAVYGSSAYEMVREDVEYVLFAAVKGVFVRSTAAPPPYRLGDPIVIDRGCGQEGEEGEA